MSKTQPTHQQPSINVFDETLQSCGADPITGFYRDGCCNTGAVDQGSHTVCVQLTIEFLLYSKSKGNDLMSPMPALGFSGLKDGDRWCLCASRWLEAYEAHKAPPVFLQSTHKRALEAVPFEFLKQCAVDLN